MQTNYVTLYNLKNVINIIITESFVRKLVLLVGSLKPNKLYLMGPALCRESEALTVTYSTGTSLSSYCTGQWMWHGFYGRL